MKANQRVVKSIPDKAGNAYTKTSAGGKSRMQAAANYMDERENTQLYTLEGGELVETDRHEAAARIEDTDTKYQQHLAFTTKLDAGDTLVNERDAAEFVARTIQERRPDAEIYAVAVHSDGKGDEKGVHVHAIVGTATTLRRDDLTHFREKSYELEQRLERDNARELTTEEATWIKGRSQAREAEHSAERHPNQTQQRGARAAGPPRKGARDGDVRENRANITLVALVLLLMGGLLLYFSYTAADRAVNAAYAPYQRGIRQYNATTRGEHLRALSVQDVFSPFHANGQMFPKQMRAGKPCGSDCIAQNAIKVAKVGPISAPWTGGLGAVLFGAGFLSALKARSQNPRRKLINLDIDRVRLKTTVDTLPIVQRGGARWGIMRRQDMKKAGRRQFGNGIFLGAPGKGKSSLLTYWLLMSDALNFVVIDLKGDLWAATAGHRATLGPVFRLDLSTLTGHALDPFDTDKRADVVGLFEILLPTDEARTAHFNRAAQEIAGAYWGAARAADIPAVPVLVQAATSNTADMLEQARELLEQAPEHRRPELLHAFRGAFGDVWEDADKGSGGERGSVLNTFRAAFAGLQTPEILSTLAARTFDPAALVEGRGTLYITAPTTNAPYKAPLEMLLGTVIDEIFSYCDRRISEGEGPGEEIVILADEAGKLKVPRFNDVLATGRGRNVTLTAFLQDLGQLRQYHQQGWRGITDTIHHWTFWNTKNPDARDFLRDHCGEFDEPNPDFSTEQGKGNGPRYFTRNTFDEMSGSWNEDDVISLLDYDRVYIVHGRAVNPFKGPPKARAGQTPPKLLRQTLPPRVVAPVSRTATPQPAPRSAIATPPRQTSPLPSTRATSGHDQGDDLNSPPAATAPTRPSAPMPTPARQPLPIFDDSDDAETF